MYILYVIVDNIVNLDNKVNVICNVKNIGKYIQMQRWRLTVLLYICKSVFMCPYFTPNILTIQYQTASRGLCQI